MNRPKAVPKLKNRDIYKGVREIIRFPHKQEWDNRLITEADGYHIPSNWTDGELDILLTQLHSCIKTGQMNGSECAMIIAVACYLRKPGVVSSDHRLIHATNFGSVPLGWNPNPSEVVEHEKPLSATDPAYGLFICALLFKILSKSSQNVVQSWSHVKDRYLNFYSSRQTPKEWPEPQLGWLDRLKNHFDQRAKRTALRFVNNLEMMYTDVEKVESGMIRYLFVMPLSYTGMHAYKLFCDVKEKTGQETTWLVSKLMCSFFREALETIDDVSRNWDLGHLIPTLLFDMQGY